MYICISFRSLGDGNMCEMTCTLQIDANVLKKPLIYKYVIFSPKMVHKDDCYEFLHSFAGKGSDPNRVLCILDYDTAVGGTCTCVCVL